MPVNLIIVKRGKDGAYGLLRQWLSEDPSVEVIWDRRLGGDRRCQRDAVSSERRNQGKGRRQRPDPPWHVFMPQSLDLWSVLRFVAVKAGAAKTTSGADDECLPDRDILSKA